MAIQNLEPERRRYQVSVVVPCYNETESVHHLAERLTELEVENSSKFNFEFVFVDDGSSDDTLELLHEHFDGWGNAIVVSHVRNRGVAAAFMTGAAHSSNDIVCTIDSDCTYDPRVIVDLVRMLSGDIVVATASPYHPEGTVGNVPEWRIWLSKLASTAYRAVFRNKLHCYTCCVRAYRRAALMEIEIKNNGFAGVTELLWRLDAKGWRIREFPAVLSLRQFGQSKMRTMQVAWSHVKLISSFAVSRIKERSNTPVPPPVSYTHLRAHETDSYLVCRLLLEKKKK